MSHRVTTLLFVLLLSALLPAQIVNLANRSSVPFDGWVRCVCDPVPPYRDGVTPGPDGQLINYVVGRQVGRVARAVDLRVTLKARQTIRLDLSQSKGGSFMRAALPDGKLKAQFGEPTLGPATLTLMGLDVDGAGYSAEFRARLGETLIAKLWVHWNPPEPWMRGELGWWSSNTASPVMSEIPPDDFGLHFGDAKVLIAGLATPEQTVVPPGQSFGDGQGRVLPVLFVWPGKMDTDTPHDQQSVAALHSFSVGAIGIDKLWAIGNPMLPTNFEPQKWASVRLPESIRRMHTFDQGVVGPNKRSADTGAQEDQVFKRSEALLENGVGAEWIAYFGAIKMASRPCHFFEKDGSLVDLRNHPELAYWFGRPYVVCRDSLGKTRGLSSQESNGWEGPDDEHFLINTLAATCRLMDSPACQELLRHQAMIYLGMFRNEKEKYPWLSIPFAARSTCWEGILVAHCWEHLADRPLAQRVMERAKDRIQNVFVPSYQNIAGDVWDWRRDDRLGPGQRWMPYQQAAGALGLDLMSELVGSEEGRKLAYRAAKAVMRDAYWFNGHYWTCRDVVAQDGAEVSSGAYDRFGCPMAIATALRVNPGDEEARTIWKQLMSGATTVGDYAWLTPGIRL